jgi:hypothetical protein
VTCSCLDEGVTREISYVLVFGVFFFAALLALDRRLHPRSLVLTRDEIDLLRSGIKAKPCSWSAKQEAVIDLEKEQR